jgi:hypothetical protein
VRTIAAISNPIPPAKLAHAAVLMGPSPDPAGLPGIMNRRSLTAAANNTTAPLKQTSCGKLDFITLTPVL